MIFLGCKTCGWWCCLIREHWTRFGCLGEEVVENHEFGFRHVEFQEMLRHLREKIYKGSPKQFQK